MCIRLHPHLPPPAKTNKTPMKQLKQLQYPLKSNQGNDCLNYKVISVKLKKISKKLNAGGTSEVTL